MNLRLRARHAPTIAASSTSRTARARPALRDGYPQNSTELGWQPAQSPGKRPAQDRNWYLDHPEWVATVSARGRLSGLDGTNYASRGETQMKGIILAGGQRHAPVPADPGDQQADAAGLRQADDLLSAVDADAGGDSRDPGYQHAGGLPVFRRLLGDGSQWGLQFSLCRTGRTARPGGSLLIGREFIGGEPVCLILGDNIFFGTGCLRSCGQLPP